MKTILDLSAQEAFEYFLLSESYSTLSLPKYFNFGEILGFVKKKIGNKDFRQCLNNSAKPSGYNNVNYNFLVNKDGRYAYRPLVLANPFLYYFLAREITKDTNWKFIQDKFSDFKKDKFEVVSIPMPKDKDEKRPSRHLG